MRCVCVLVLVICLLQAEARWKNKMDLKELLQGLLEEKQELCGVQSAVTEAEMTEIVELHNKYRRKEKASDMIKLRHSEELSRIAQEYADGCHFEHGIADSCSKMAIGQNLYYKAAAEGEAQLEFSPDAPVDSWMKEKDYYFQSNKTCSQPCGHYRQIVYAATREVGCGYTQCPVLTANAPYTMEKVQMATNALFVVCDYKDRAGYGDLFKKGRACSKCPGETKCAMQIKMCEQCNLEEPGCICPYTKSMCAESKNIRITWNCKLFRDKGDCDGGEYHTWAMRNCAKTCNCYLLKKEPARCKT